MLRLSTCRSLPSRAESVRRLLAGHRILRSRPASHPFPTGTEQPCQLRLEPVQRNRGVLVRTWPSIKAGSSPAPQSARCGRVESLRAAGADLRHPDCFAKKDLNLHNRLTRYPSAAAPVLRDVDHFSGPRIPIPPFTRISLRIRSHGWRLIVHIDGLRPSSGGRPIAMRENEKPALGRSLGDNSSHCHAGGYPVRIYSVKPYRVGDDLLGLGQPVV